MALKWTLPILAVAGCISLLDLAQQFARLPAASAQESEEGERGPSLETLREIRQGIQESSGGETISPDAPSGGGGSAGVMGELRGTIPQFEPLGPRATGRELESAPYEATGEASSRQVFLQVQAPRDLILGGAPLPSCAGRRAGRNQAVICVSGSSLDPNSSVTVLAPPMPHLKRLSHTPGNPTQAVFLFTAPGPGRYTFTFMARLGNDSVTEPVEIEVRQKAAPANQEPVLTLTKTGVLGVRAEAFDPDRTDRLCVRPANPANLVNPREVCGAGRVTADYRVSDALVRNDPPRLVGFSQLVEPSCKRLQLIFLVVDGKGSQTRDSIDIGINGLWRAGYGGWGAATRFQFVRVTGC